MFSSGGFSHQYLCVCDQLGLPYREEVQWVSIKFNLISFLKIYLFTISLLIHAYTHICLMFLLQDVDTIYLTQDSRELNLQDFIHLENRYASASTSQALTHKETLQSQF